MNEEKWILYRTTNICNCKIYVGVHKVTDTSKSKKYLGSGLTLRLAMQKYGRKNFSRVTLEEFSCAEDAYLAETNMVTEDFVKREDTYNLKIGGRGCRGLVHTPESRAKMSVAQKGKVHTAEAKAKMSASGKGKVISEKQKAQIGAAAKGNKYWVGRTHTPEALEKMRNSQLGKTLTPEHKAKISASTMGKAKSAETRARMSASGKGKIISDKQKAQMSAARKGKQFRLGMPHSEETKAKMRENITDERKAVMRENYGIAIVINGEYYPSASFATSVVEASTATILSRARSEKPKFADYRFANPEEKAAHFLEVSRQST